MFKPKQLVDISIRKFKRAEAWMSYNRAMLTKMLSDGKLLSTFPSVFEPKERNPAMPMARHMIRDTPVE